MTGTDACAIAVGAVSGLGLGVDAYRPGPAGAAARSAITHDPVLEAAGLRRPLAARAPAELGVAPGADRATDLLRAALAQALAGLDAARPDWRSERVGVAVGTSSGGMLTAERFFEARERGAVDAALARGATYFAPLDEALAAVGLGARSAAHPGPGGLRRLGGGPRPRAALARPGRLRRGARGRLRRDQRLRGLGLRGAARHHRIAPAALPRRPRRDVAGRGRGDRRPGARRRHAGGSGDRAGGRVRRVQRRHPHHRARSHRRRPRPRCGRRPRRRRGGAGADRSGERARHRDAVQRRHGVARRRRGAAAPGRRGGPGGPPLQGPDRPHPRGGRRARGARRRRRAGHRRGPRRRRRGGRRAARCGRARAPARPGRAAGPRRGPQALRRLRRIQRRARPRAPGLAQRARRAAAACRPPPRLGARGERRSGSARRGHRCGPRPPRPPRHAVPPRPRRRRRPRRRGRPRRARRRRHRRRPRARHPGHERRLRRSPPRAWPHRGRAARLPGHVAQRAGGRVRHRLQAHRAQLLRGRRARRGHGGARRGGGDVRVRRRRSHGGGRRRRRRPGLPRSAALRRLGRTRARVRRGRAPALGRCSGLDT